MSRSSASNRVEALEGRATSRRRARWRHLWKRALKLAKLDDPQPVFHDLRHAYATYGLASGLGSHAVAALLGHSDAGLVERRYGHALPDELAGAADRIAAWREAARVR